MEYIALYPETLALVKRYPEAQRCRLYEAMANYAFTGEEPTWPEDALEWYGWEALKQQVDRARSKSEQSKANGSKAKRTEAKASEPERTEANGSGSKRTEADLPKEKEKETENEKERDIDAGATACAREDTPFGAVAVDPVIVELQKNIGALTVSHYDDLAAFRQDIPDDLVLEAISEAVAHGARTWAYVRSILQGYIKDHVKTVGQARERSERRKREGPPGKRVTAQLYDQARHTEEELEARVSDL